MISTGNHLRSCGDSHEGRHWQASINCPVPPIAGQLLQVPPLPSLTTPAAPAKGPPGTGGCWSPYSRKSLLLQRPPPSPPSTGWSCQPLPTVLPSGCQQYGMLSPRKRQNCGCHSPSKIQIFAFKLAFLGERVCPKQNVHSGKQTKAHFPGEGKVTIKR